MFTDQPLGEVPPQHVLLHLRSVWAGMRHTTADRLWDAAASGAVALFEGWKSA